MEASSSSPTSDKTAHSLS